MSNYSVLKQDINNNIYENQTQQITGTVLNAILNEMAASLGAGYQFAGVATLGMNPGDPDQRVFYLAGEGIYTNFGGLQVPAGKLGVLKWDNRWTLQTIDGLGGGGANLTGYVSVASTDDLPDEGVATLGYLCGTNLYLYVGEGGDTKEGKYQNCGSFRGPEGAYIQDIEQTETSHENGGRNTIKMTLSDGRSFNAYVHNGTTSSGLFPTLEALQAAYPSPVVGQYAFVGAGFPADIYVCTTAGTWTDSGEDYDGDNVDLTNYATKAEVNQLEAKVDEKYQVAYTSGKLAITKNREFSVANNLVCKVGGTSYTIPGGSSFTLTNITTNSSSLWAIIFDTANLRLIAKAWSSTVRGDVIICAVVANSTTTISGVVNCVVPYTFDGKYFTTAQTNEIISAVGLADLGQKYGVFYTKGILQFNSSRSVKNTENLTCRIGSTNYTIPAGTVSDLSNITAGYSPLWEIVFNISTLKLEAKAWNNSTQKDLVVATAVAVNSTIGKIGHCVVPHTLDGKDPATDVGYLLKNRLVPVATQGYINCDNVNKKFVTSKNIVIRFNNTTYTIPAGTEIQYSWSMGNTSLYKLCADVTANPLAFKIVQASNDTELPVLFTFYGTGTSTANNVVVQVVTSIITTKIDGKDLADRVTSLENDVTPVKDQNYQGEHILIDSRKFARKAIPVASSLGQSFASYGDYLVTCNYSDSAVTAKVMSLSNRTLLATLNLPYGSLNRPHCNVCCFGNEFGSADSIVPLLYVSQWDYEYERGVLVYDIKLINGVYSAVLVQTIIPNNIGTEFLGSGCVDWVVDTDNSMIYALAYYLAGSSTIVEGNKEMVCKFALPKLSDGSLVELTESDILNNWEMEMFNFSQDKCYNSGKIFVLSGYNTYPDWTKIRVIDLARKEIVSVIPLSQYGGEPEGMDVVQGFLTYGYSGTNIYRLFF